jgi:hypothetical protein
MRKPNPYRQALKLLEQLHKEYPDYTLGRHLSTAFADYGDIWAVSDKELLYALQKYQSLMDVDNMSISEDYINMIMEDSKHLDEFVEDEDDIFN